MADNAQDSTKAREKALQKSKRALEGAGSEVPRPAKKLKVAALNTADSDNGVKADMSATLPPLDPLAGSYDLTTMNIISSSKIELKVKRALEILAEYPAVPPAKSKVIRLHAKAPVASKLITIVEIAKREIKKDGGKWFQYNKVEEIMEEQKPKSQDKGKSKDKQSGETKTDEGEDKQGSEEDAEEFETMKTPFERSIEGKPKVRAVPIMITYLSRVRIDTLKKEHG